MTDVEAIRERHARFATVPFAMESHEHGEKGCRCGSCCVCTGWAIHAGRNCDEHPDAVNASDGGCVRGVLEHDQAEYLIQAVADVGALLETVNGMINIIASWLPTHPMPYATPGEPVQPWHLRALAAYDADRGIVTAPDSNIPGMYAAAQVNEAIVWWNKRAAGNT